MADSGTTEAGGGRAIDVAGWPADGLEAVHACPLCAASRGPIIHHQLQDLVNQAPGSWEMRGCGTCGCAYLDPRPTVSSIGLAYATYATHAATEHPDRVIGMAGMARRALKNGYLAHRHGYDLSPCWPVGSPLLAVVPGAARRASRFVRHLDHPPPGASLLDVGCGNGSFLLSMRQVGWRIQGTEPDSVAAARAAAAGVPVVAGLLEEGMFQSASFDVVTLNHVLEHLHDPVATLRICRALLKPTGHCWVATPNLCSEGHRRYGRAWRGLEPPRHLVVFAPASLDLAFASAGFGTRSRLPAGLEARHLFLSSEQIAGRPAGRRRQAVAASMTAELRAWRDPDRAEELVVAAWP
ncbi:MAG: class I SAM-dependent methyltransferase [Acidimicrobiales bacterium]